MKERARRALSQALPAERRSGLVARPRTVFSPRVAASAPGISPPRPLSLLGQVSHVALELSAPLIAGFDYETSFREVARLVSSRVASGCVIDFYVDDELRRIAVVPADCKLDLAAGLAPFVEAVRERGQPAASSERGLRCPPGMDWVLCVPLTAPSGVLGTMTFLGSRTLHAPVPLALARELGRRAGAALENARLYHGAVNALEARDRVLSMVSHDLRNPLGVILMGASRLVEQTPKHERRSTGRREADAILRSARRMKSLISDLLDLSASDSGRLALRPALVDVPALLQSLVGDLQPQAAASGIALGVELAAAAAVPEAWADPDRVAQVITNLVGNAMKFTQRGGSVRVVLRALPEELEVSVRDNGPGIHPEDLPRIFERFWQAPETAAKGTGLGLAICKTIVEQSGGHIRAESELGRGTTVRFTVPSSSARS